MCVMRHRSFRSLAFNIGQAYFENGVGQMRMKILIVEPNIEKRICLGTLLMKNPKVEYAVSAADPSSARQKCRNEIYDLGIIRTDMHEESGYVLAEQLQDAGLIKRAAFLGRDNPDRNNLIPIGCYPDDIGPEDAFRMIELTEKSLVNGHSAEYAVLKNNNKKQIYAIHAEYAGNGTWNGFVEVKGEENCSPFSGWDSLLVLLDKLCDKNGYPRGERLRQAFQGCYHPAPVWIRKDAVRREREKSGDGKRSGPEIAPLHFLVKLFFRSCGSFQGTVVWQKTGENVNFSSALQFLYLIRGAARKAEENMPAF